MRAVVPTPAEQGQQLALARGQARQRPIGRPVPGHRPLAFQHRPGDPQHRAGAIGLAHDPGGPGADHGQQQIGVVVVAQHQIGTAAGDVGKGVLGRTAAADHLWMSSREQRLQRFVEQRLRIRNQHPRHDHPDFRAALTTFGCLLWPIGAPPTYYSSSKPLYDSRRQFRILQGSFEAFWRILLKFLIRSVRIPVGAVMQLYHLPSVLRWVARPLCSTFTVHK